MDLTGRFPYCSSRGNEYILIAYHYDSNAILGLPIRNRQAATITAAWSKLHDNLSVAGSSPNLWILDNETSTELRTAMQKRKTKFQLVPPHNHRANASEQAIQTFKNHFKSGLASLDPDFPMREWDRLLNQAFLTLNLLRPSRINPALSAYAYLFGLFNFDATPLAPPGIKTMTHSKPNVRASWDPNAKLSWYIGPALQHYRCVKVFLPDTRAEINTDTVTFIPKHISIPSYTTEDHLKQAATDIVTLLTHPPKESSLPPNLELGDSTKNALLQIATILGRNSVPAAVIQRQQQSTTAAAAALQRKLNTTGDIPATQSTTLIQPHPSSRILSKKNKLDILKDTINRLTRVLQPNPSSCLPHNRFSSPP